MTTGSTSPNARAISAATHAPDVKSLDVLQAVDFYTKGTELAHSATTNDEYIKAIELFSIAIAIRSDQSRFFFARANAFRAINEFEYALKDYTLAITIDDRLPLYYANRGACYRKLNQPIQALEDLTAAIEMDIKKANHYFNRALVLYEGSYYKEAILDFTKTLEDGNGGIRMEYRVLQSRSNCYRKLGLLQKCIDDLQNAIKLDGRNPTGFNLLAQAYMEIEDYDNAIEHFSNAIQLSPTQASYFTLRGICYYKSTTRTKSQNARRSLEDFNQSMKLDGKDPQAYFYRGAVRLLIGLAQLEDESSNNNHRKAYTDVEHGSRLILSAEEQLEAAFADVEAACSLCPKGIKYQLAIAIITQLREKYRDAHILFRDIHTSTTKTIVIVKYHWALCCHMLCDYETALNLLCDCIEAIPDESLFYEARGLVLQDAGHHASAIDDFTSALDLTTEALHNENQNCTQEMLERTHRIQPVWNLYLRGVSNFRLGNFDDAIIDFTEALKVQKKSSLEATVRDARAMAQRGLGNYEDAINDLTVCLTLTPGHDVFAYHRGLCYFETKHFAEAVPDFTLVSRKNPQDTYVLYYIGLSYFHNKQTEECITTLTQAIERDIASCEVNLSSTRLADVLPDLHYHVGLAHAIEGRNMPAIEHFSLAVDHATAILAKEEASNPLTGAPDAVTQQMLLYIHERAKALQLERYFDEAIDDFTYVVEHNPNNAHAYFRRGFAYKAIGNLNAAASDLETARQLDPKNPKLMVNYRELKDTECLILCLPGDEKSF